MEGNGVLTETLKTGLPFGGMSAAVNKFFADHDLDSPNKDVQDWVAENYGGVTPKPGLISFIRCGIRKRRNGEYRPPGRAKSTQSQPPIAEPPTDFRMTPEEEASGDPAWGEDTPIPPPKPPEPPPAPLMIVEALPQSATPLASKDGLPSVEGLPQRVDAVQIKAEASLTVSTGFTMSDFIAAMGVVREAAERVGGLNNLAELVGYLQRMPR